MPTFLRPIAGNPLLGDTFQNHVNRIPTSANPGQDYKVVRNTPVLAPESGIIGVDDDNASGAAGISVVIYHDNGWSSDLMHLTRNVVVSNQRVVKGQLVGYSGNTGYSTGPHLHWSLRPVHSNTYSNKGNVNPELYVSSEGTPSAGENEMKLIRHPNGTVSLVGETTYTHLSLPTWIAIRTTWGAFTQLTDVEFNATIAVTQIARAYLYAGMPNGGGGSTVDPAAIALKVEQQLADDFVRLADQIAELNAAIAEAGLDEEELTRIENAARIGAEKGATDALTKITLVSTP